MCILILRSVVIGRFESLPSGFYVIFLKMEFALFAPLMEKTVYFIYIPHITQLLYPCSMLVQAAVPEFWVDRVYSGPLS